MERVIALYDRKITYPDNPYFSKEYTKMVDSYWSHFDGIYNVIDEADKAIQELRKQVD
ncbi:MAG: hypothetical protein GX763_00540 [Clostridiaceae bacterium]|nr:hypothetical protein [Clostridiaceae bacterium]